ncbi:MAG: trimethylamine methyltransferase family protein [Chloroflexota bacterium]|nr:MAG: trimethylamine methyltransferase family protein [Chloroflexota bacterium]
MYTQTPDILPFTSPFKPQLLSESEINILKEKTLEILNEVGVRFPSSKALDIFADHGARVDRETGIVRIQPDLVYKAMSTAPRSFILGGREKRFDLFLDGNCSYLSTDGTGVHVVDLETRQKRASCKADVALMARVCDALPLIGFYWPMVSAQDYGQTASLHQCHAGLTNTLKHVRGGTTMHPRLAQYVVDMATVVAGSDEALKKRPPICANICTISPLSHDREGIESALIYAQAGIPISFMAMPTMGSTAPATPLGALVQGDAEVVSAMVLMQLAYPGTPVFHAIFTSLMNPRTGSYISEVPTASYVMAKELAHGWKVPCLGGARVSGDAPGLGWQSGFEVGLGTGMSAIAGSEICGLMGLISSAMTLYPEEVILDHDAYNHVYEILNSKRLTELEPSLDVIKAVKQGGHFLAQKHTREYMRKFHISAVRDQKDSDNQPRDPRQVAIEIFKHLEASHHPQPLPEKVLAELDKILATAEREAEVVFAE